MSKNVSVTMRVKVGEAELEVTGPKNFVENKIEEFMKLQKSTSTLPAVPTQVSLSGKKPTAPAQFFKSLDLKSDVERILAAGFYLEQLKGIQSFTAAELKDIVCEAKVQPPKNPNDSVAKNIKKGLMMSSGDKDGKNAYVLTTDGEDAIKEMAKKK